MIHYSLVPLVIIVVGVVFVGTCLRFVIRFHLFILIPDKVVGLLVEFLEFGFNLCCGGEVLLIELLVLLKMLGLELISLVLGMM